LGARITSLNVWVWAKAPCPSASGQTHIRSFARPSPLPNSRHWFIFANDQI
jgi:hypothetical protein